MLLVHLLVLPLTGAGFLRWDTGRGERGSGCFCFVSLWNLGSGRDGKTSSVVALRLADAKQRLPLFCRPSGSFLLFF